MPNPRVFFDFTINDEPVGRVIFELFSDRVPKTCENFRALCTGEKGLSRLSQVPLYYKGSIVHRSIGDFMIQGGDFTHRNGKGGEPIYGTPFPDEDLSQPTDSEGLLCMANKGPNTNGSQWFITLASCPHLNGKHVVFGRVIRGYAETIEKIAAVPTDERDRPSVPVVISHCGELVLRNPVQISRTTKAPSDLSASESDSDSDRDKRRRKKRSQRRRRDSRSLSPDNSSDNERKSKKIKRDKHKKHRRSTNDEIDVMATIPRKETEEEYDARLEREENERKEGERRREIARAAERLARSTPKEGENGIVYKGRGRMKYIDPESRFYRRE